MSSEVAIEVSDLSKCYEIYEQPRDRLKQFVLPRFQRALGRSPRRYYREFWALSGVSLQVRRGETVGIIGRNGSGKSTLLQMICGTLSATEGTITTKGRIAALLELGSGFNPDFTGRENVHMNAAVLGLSKEEIDARFDDIAAFADIGEFIERPVKTYSSGMMVRLAFAVQAQVAPDILVVDEALAVGDAKFQAKCFERVKQLKQGGTSILLVTHSSEQIVTHCNRALLLDGGRPVQIGQSKDVVNTYLDLLFGKGQKDSAASESDAGGGSEEASGSAPVTSLPSARLSCVDDVFSTRSGYNQYEYRWGDGSARILDFYLSADDRPYPIGIESGQKLNLEFSVKFIETLIRPIVGVTIKTKEGVTVYGVNSETLDVGQLKELGKRGTVATVRAELDCRLAPGDYFISIGIATKSGEEIVPHDRRYDAIHIQILPTTKFFGLVDLGLKMKAEEILE
jgi:lipopolysaccharide transport system ATP-binding protein